VAAPADVKRWLAWCRRGEIGQRLPHASRPADWAAMIPGPADRHALIGPLADREGPAGVAIVVAPPDARAADRRAAAPRRAGAGRRFDAAHVAMFRALLEPFATALENDRRVRELKALREAAEADRRSLLARLGRRGPGDTIVGAETGLRLVMGRVTEAGASDVPVLILGEPGSGKEVVARAIHTASARAGGPFIRVNCGAIAAGRADAELFGEDGHAGGDAEAHHGWVNRAAGGTLFLDEVGEIPLGAQERLLRVAAGAPGPSAERVGAPTDVRLIAATFQDLAGLVREGRFRQDLWYRLAAFPVLLPPLRERTGDIPGLARHFAQRAAIRFGLPVRMPSAEDLSLLMAYPWPGNVRELAAVIDRAALLSRGERLEIGAALGAGSPPPTGEAGSTRGAPRGPLVSLDEAMKQHIEAALALAEGRIEGAHGAARILGINPHTLRARMRKLGVAWDRFRSREARGR
jgi:DNA-binding NtrC family response regulator